MNPENLGWLERPFVEAWAHAKASFYCLRCPLKCKVVIEYRWLEDRNKKDRKGYPIYREQITFIGVSRLDRNNRVTVVKSYLGESRLL